MTALARPREKKDVPSEGNPVSAVRHTRNGTTEECLGLRLHLWCPGCQQLHAPTFHCPEDDGPAVGPTWEGDPYADPVAFEPSLLVRYNGADGEHVCHSFVRAGAWQFLGDSTHALAGQTVPLEPLPDWLVR